VYILGHRPEYQQSSHVIEWLTRRRVGEMGFTKWAWKARTLACLLLHQSVFFEVRHLPKQARVTERKTVPVDVIVMQEKSLLFVEVTEVTRKPWPMGWIY
jgi:hypothetical protein